MADEYTCECCSKTYPKGWTDEEALAELEVVFAVPVEECAVVCDDCYRAMGFGG